LKTQCREDSPVTTVADLMDRALAMTLKNIEIRSDWK